MSGTADDSRRVELSAASVFGVLASVAVALVAAGLCVQVARFTVGLPATLVVAFDLNGERNVPALYGGALLALAAGLCLLVAASARRRCRHWYGLAAVAGFLSLDELLSIHERLNPLVLSATDGLLPDGMPFVWMLAYVVPCALLAWTYLPFVLSLGGSVARPFVAAAVTYVGGAAGLELVEGWVTSLTPTSDTLWRAIVVALEEGLELTGVCLAILAILRHVAGRAAPLVIAID